MKRKLLAVACLGALMAPSCVVPAVETEGRHFKLEGDLPEGVHRAIAGTLKNLSLDGDKPTTWETLTRTGTFHDKRYGEFEITRPMLLEMVSNFEKGTYGQEVFIDVGHEPGKGSAAKVLKLAVEGNKLRALLEWTPYGVDAVKRLGMRYFSLEYHDNWQDNEKRVRHGAVMLGAGLTIRPVIKNLDPVQLAEAGGPALHPELVNQIFQENQVMWKQLMEALKAKLGSFKLADAVVVALCAAAEKALAPVTDEASAKALIAAFESSGKQLAEQIGDNVIKLDISIPDVKTGLNEDQVKKLMADETQRIRDAAKQLQEVLDKKQKLLSEAIAAEKGLSDELKKELTEGVKDLITAEMTDEQVKKLAENQISQGNKRVAAEKLAERGFVLPSGTPRISVDDSNTVKKLQDEMDKRLGFAGMSDGKRYAKTGGKLLDENKELCTKVLAMFDAAHAHQLRDEAKMLAAGDGKVSDVSVPAIFERTVIREALSSLIGLQFVNVGTSPFSQTALIPYSYRDTTAAGRSNARVYEGGSIARAGVKQTSDTAYPTPQKLAFEVSDELRYLTANGQIDWDAVIENVRNASRIIGEDSEHLMFDEVLNASDQYGAVDVVNEAIAVADGAKTIFITDNFPVVRPKTIKDLQGNTVGVTLYPIVVKTNAVVRTEYDFTGTQVAGLYWYMDYNKGEIHFVTELGAPSAPTNTHAILASYTKVTNCYNFDTDLGADAIDDHWNKFLYRYGLRKAVIESDRFFNPNFGLMSMTAMTQIEQAKQFSANFSRPGTDLTADGTLGRVKGVPNFNTTAPGLNMGDERIVIGERGNTRFRMMKPWSMGQMQDQRDANGRFTGKKEAYGDQFVVLHTPTPLKAATTGILLYAAGARVDR